MTSADAITPPRADRPLWASGLALILLITLARLAYLAWFCPYTLIEDEAHYWEWSRRLELSYYSKGPGVAWAIRAATELFGTSAWAVRVPAVVSGAIGAWCVAGLARDACSTHPGGTRAGLYAAAIYLCMPAFWVLGIIITIDGPYLACWAAACWAAWRVLTTNSPRAWAALGLAIAIGFIAVIGIKTGYTLYVDVAIALGLVGFLATVAFARFVLSRGKTEDDILAEARQAASIARREAKTRSKAATPDGKPDVVVHPGAGQTAKEPRQ